jgi:acetoin utilization protein AcuC
MLGWFAPEQYRESPQATVTQLLQFHHPDYVEALRRAEARGSVDKAVRERYRIGTMENPLFPGVFRRASTPGIDPRRNCLDGRVVFHPRRHAPRPSRASLRYLTIPCSPC